MHDYDDYECGCPDCGSRHRLQNLKFAIENKVTNFLSAIREIYDPKYRELREAERERLRIFVENCYSKEFLARLKETTAFEKIAQRRALPLKTGATIQFFEYDKLDKTTPT